MVEFKNEFSWSKSRDNIFKECNRKYFFNYYGYWNGWHSESEDRVKRIYYLKKLKTKELWVGTLVHEVIEFVLKKFRVSEIITLGHALAILEKKAESDFNISKLKEYTGFMSKAHKFFEDEYGIEISADDKKKLLRKARLCVTNFFNSDIFMEIRRTKLEDWVTLEDFLSFDFQGTKIYLSIDFAMKVGDKIILFDWKTGEERLASFDLQLTLYSLYVIKKFGISTDKIETRIFNLTIDKIDNFIIDDEKIDEIKRYMQESISKMKKLLRDDSNNEAKEEDFEKNEGFRCSRCNFKKVCDKKRFPMW